MSRSSIIGVRAGCSLLLMLSASTLLTAVNLLREKQKKIQMHGRIVASVTATKQTTNGRNHRDYLFKVENGGGASSIVRLSYRFMHRAGDLPVSFLDPAFVHSFKAVRDPGCDEKLEVLATRYVFDEHGFQFLRTEPALHFVQEEDTQLSADTVLACYITTPQDYKGSKAPKQGGR